MLAQLRLTSGEPVRFRKAEGGRWLPGKMSGVASRRQHHHPRRQRRGAQLATGASRGAPARQPRPADVAVGQRRGDHVGAAWRCGATTPASKAAAAANVASAPMTEPARIEVEPDPVPIVLILAATLRRAARTPKLAAAIGQRQGQRRVEVDRRPAGGDDAIRQRRRHRRPRRLRRHRRADRRRHQHDGRREPADAEGRPARRAIRSWR